MSPSMTSRRGSSAGGGTRSNLDIVGIIGRKRDGHTLGSSEIRSLIEAYVRDHVPDYQMSALLMAIVFRGLDADETLALTQAMVESGDTVDTSSLGRRIVDKHSTGGVGDKVSIALGPIVAACGVPFAKMSGRGLGHTGGTLDKLESIAGYTCELSQDRFLKQVSKIGIAIVGQTADIVPADKRLYALRDVTGTVESIPLIAASIMSKKLAAGADAIVLDVKTGSGAFMKDIEQARVLADTMIKIGHGAGRDVKVMITDMSAPLGNAVGNAVEIAEVQALLRESGSPRLTELVLSAAALLLSLSDLGVDEAQGRNLASSAIADGSAWQKYEQWIKAQGGDPSAVLPAAPVQHTVLASTSGTVTAIDALTVGRAAAALGAGRRTKKDVIDHSVGVVMHTDVVTRIAAGEPLMTIHAKNEAQAHEAAALVEAATKIISGPSPGKVEPVVIERRG